MSSEQQQESAPSCLLRLPSHLFLKLLPTGRTQERQDCLVSLLGTCKSIRDHLYPLLRWLDASYYRNLLIGYYSLEDPFSSVDYYFSLSDQEITLIMKFHTRSDTHRTSWGLKKQIVDELHYSIAIKLGTAASTSTFTFPLPILTYRRDQEEFPTMNPKYTRLTPELFEERHQRQKGYLACGMGFPCPNKSDYTVPISNIAREYFRKVPQTIDNYNSLLLEMAGIAEKVNEETMWDVSYKEEAVRANLLRRMVWVCPKLEDFFKAEIELYQKT